jgi:hypothetical protein
MDLERKFHRNCGEDKGVILRREGALPYPLSKLRKKENHAHKLKKY